MNGQQLAPMTVGFAIAVVLILVIGFFRRKRNMIAHLAPVKLPGYRRFHRTG